MAREHRRTLLRAALSRELPAWTRIVVDVAGVALLALFLWGFVDRNFRVQPDLNVYRFAGRAALAGLDPYVQENLIAVADRHVFPFLYTPVTLLPCMAVAFAPWHALALGWMWSKIVLLGLLVVAWARGFGRDAMVLPLALVATFGWSSSGLRDLWCGNVVIVETALVWAGLAAYVADRRQLFACLIVAAATFKVAPAAFLLLLLVPTAKRRPDGRRLAINVAALAIVVGGPLLIGPAAGFRRFWEGVPNWTLTGSDNPTVVGFLVELVRSVRLERWPSAVRGDLGRLQHDPPRRERALSSRLLAPARRAAVGDDRGLPLHPPNTAAARVRIHSPHTGRALFLAQLPWRRRGQVDRRADLLSSRALRTDLRRVRFALRGLRAVPSQPLPLAAGCERCRKVEAGLRGSPLRPRRTVRGDARVAWGTRLS